MPQKAGGVVEKVGRWDKLAHPRLDLAKAGTMGWMPTLIDGWMLMLMSPVETKTLLSLGFPKQPLAAWRPSLRASGR